MRSAQRIAAISLLLGSLILSDVALAAQSPATTTTVLTTPLPSGTQTYGFAEGTNGTGWIAYGDLKTLYLQRVDADGKARAAAVLVHQLAADSTASFTITDPNQFAYFSLSASTRPLQINRLGHILLQYDQTDGDPNKSYYDNLHRNYQVFDDRGIPLGPRLSIDFNASIAPGRVYLLNDDSLVVRTVTIQNRQLNVVLQRYNTQGLALGNSVQFKYGRALLPLSGIYVKEFDIDSASDGSYTFAAHVIQGISDYYPSTRTLLLQQVTANNQLAGAVKKVAQTQTAFIFLPIPIAGGVFVGHTLSMGRTQVQDSGTQSLLWRSDRINATGETAPSMTSYSSASTQAKTAALTPVCFDAVWLTADRMLCADLKASATNPSSEWVINANVLDTTGKASEPSIAIATVPIAGLSGGTIPYLDAAGHLSVLQAVIDESNTLNYSLSRFQYVP